MVETQTLYNRNGYYKQYVVTHNNYVILVTTNMTMAEKLKQEIKQKEEYGTAKIKR